MSVAATVQPDVDPNRSTTAQQAFMAKHYATDPKPESTPTTQQAESQGGEGSEGAASEETPDTGTTSEESGAEDAAQGEESTPETPGAENKGQALKALMEKYAKDTGLDPAANEKVLRMLAEKELLIQGQRQKLQTTKPEAQPLTEFEKSLQKKPESDTPEKPAAETKPEKPSASAERVSKEWRSLSDAQKAYGEAWESKDLSKAAAVQEELFLAHLFQNRDLLESIVGEVIGKRFGDVLPSVSEMAWQQKVSKARDAALADLKKVPGFETIEDDLYRREEGKITLDGGEFDNTPFNRVLRDYPEIGDIYVEHQDPETAARLTLTKRFRMAAAILKKDRKEPESSKKVLEAGMAAGNEQAKQRFRQGINQGSGAGQPKGGEENYASTLKSRSALGRNLSSL